MQEQLTPLIGIIITALLSAWKLDAVKKSTFDLFGKLPRFLQWVPAVFLAMLTTGFQGYLSGKPFGEELFVYAAGSGAEAGALAIAFWHVIKRFKKEAVAPVASMLLVCLIGFGQAGCNRATIDAQIDKALLIEDKVFAQVDYLDSVFQALVENPTIPTEDRLRFRQQFADRKAKLMQLMHAKDEALELAKAANSEVINLRELADGIVDVVQEIIGIVAMVGANPLLVQEQQTRAMGLTRGM